MKPNLTTTKKNTTQWVQTERKAHEAWAKLIGKSPKAAQLMHVLTANIGENNAVIASHATLAEMMDVSVMTVRRSIEILREGLWIEVRQVGKASTANAYVINDRVAWTQPRENLRFSLFTAAVIVSSSEQPDKDQLGNQEPLKRLPKVGEMQIPSGDGLPPPSQPSLPDFEPDLPSAGQQTDIEEYLKDYQKNDIS